MNLLNSTIPISVDQAITEAQVFFEASFPALARRVAL